MGKIDLNSPLKTALGSRSAAKLVEKLDLQTVGDLLRYYPRKYDQRGKLTDLAALVEGERATVWARVVKVTERELGLAAVRGGKGRGVRHITNVVIGDSQQAADLHVLQPVPLVEAAEAGHRRDVLRQGHQVQQDPADQFAVGGDRRRRPRRIRAPGTARTRSTSSSRSPAG